MQDATLSIDLLCSLKNCNGRIAGTFGIFLPVFQTLTDLTIATGMCLGGHLVGHHCKLATESMILGSFRRHFEYATTIFNLK